MKLAVTGAAGFVGGHLVAEAHRRGHDVVALIRPDHAAPADVEVIRVDLGQDRAGLDFSGLDAVLHAAGRVEWGSFDAFRRDNPDATGEVARACAAAGVRMVHVSTTAVFGSRAPETGTVTEDSPFGYRVDAWDRYTTSKIGAELRLRAIDDLDVAVNRPGFIIGPGDRNTERLVGLLNAAVTPLVGRGNNRLPVVSVFSVVDAILRAAVAPTASGRSYNIACDWSVTQRGFYDALAAARGLQPRYLPVPYGAFFAAGLAAEAIATKLPLSPPWSRSAAALLGLDADFPTTRAEAELGWEPARSLEEAVA